MTGLTSFSSKTISPHDHGVVPRPVKAAKRSDPDRGSVDCRRRIAWKSLRGEADLEHALLLIQRALKAGK